MSELYDQIGVGYATRRRPDPRIYARIRRRLDGMRSVVNVGAGTGSYEPRDLNVIAVEPSQVMITQRADRSRVIRAVAEALPLRDACADAVTAILTIHHWRDWKQGLGECARVARRQLTLLTWDPASTGFWLVEDYFPEIPAWDRTVFPSIAQLAAELGPCEIEAVPVPADCVDGFLGAWWKRPAAYLDPHVRAGISSFARLHDIDQRIARLRADLDAGEWARRNAALADRDELDTGLRLVTAQVRRGT